MNRVERIEREMGRVTTLRYAANGQVRERVEPNGQKATLGYNVLGRVATAEYRTAGGAIERSQTFGYDPEGNLTGVTESLGAATRSYEKRYDARGRMHFERDAT